MAHAVVRTGPTQNPTSPPDSLFCARVSLANDGVLLSFLDPSNVQGTTITGYEYNVSFDGGTTWVTCNKDNAYKLQAQTGRIRNVRSDGHSSETAANAPTSSERCLARVAHQWSNRVTTMPLSAPTSHSATRVAGGVSLSFAPPTDLQAAHVTGYEYNVSTDGGTTWVTGNKDQAYNSFSDLPSLPRHHRYLSACPRRAPLTVRAVAGVWHSTWSDLVRHDQTGLVRHNRNSPTGESARHTGRWTFEPQELLLH